MDGGHKIRHRKGIFCLQECVLKAKGPQNGVVGFGSFRNAADFNPLIGLVGVDALAGAVTANTVRKCIFCRRPFAGACTAGQNPL